MLMVVWGQIQKSRCGVVSWAARIAYVEVKHGPEGSLLSAVLTQGSTAKTTKRKTRFMRDKEEVVAGIMAAGEGGLFLVTRLWKRER